MKIAMLNASVSRKNGGIFEAARRLSQELAAQDGNEISVLGTADEFSEADRHEWQPISPNIFRPRYFRPYAFAPEFASTLHFSEPDICQVHGLWTYASLAAQRWHARTARPYIITVHGMLDPWALQNSRWKKKLIEALFERRNLTEAACLHAHTQAEVEAIRDFGLKNAVCVVPNGVDLPPAHDHASPPWKDEVAPGKKILLYLGRLHPKKGLLALEEAWAKTKPADWELVILGWDQAGHSDLLKSRARALGINVHFAGPQFGHAKSAAYAHADAFILPSLSEGLPLVVLEAWANRLPVLMTPACNLPEGFSAKTAIEIQPSADSIAAGIKALTSMQPEERTAMGERGRALVERSYSWPSIASQMQKVYRWMLGLGDRPESVST